MNAIYNKSTYKFKVVIVGNAGVGKSSLMLRFIKGMFSPNLCPTIGVDYMVKNVLLRNGIKVTLQIWDTAGQERFRSVTKTYYRSAAALILVYDITDKFSFDCLDKWITDIDDFADKCLCKYLIGNKMDKQSQRQISEYMSKEFARKYNLKHVEVSALSSINVDSAFYQLASDLVAAYDKKYQDKLLKILQTPQILGGDLDEDKIKLTKEPNVKCCCQTE